MERQIGLSEEVFFTVLLNSFVVPISGFSGPEVTGFRDFLYERNRINRYRIKCGLDIDISLVLG